MTTRATGSGEEPRGDSLSARAPVDGAVAVDDKRARMKSTTTLVTSERVPLLVPLAGIGERALAYGVDLALVMGVTLAGAFLYNFWGDLEDDLSSLSTTAALLVVIGLFLAAVLYDVIGDVVFDGRTLGKRVMKLRVVTDNAERPDLLTSVLRNTSRLIDFLPGGYGLGSTVLFITGSRRIGDLVAGTFVIKEHARDAGTLTTLRQFADDAPALSGEWTDDDDDDMLRAVMATRHLQASFADRRVARVLTRTLRERAGANANAVVVEEVGARARVAATLLLRATRDGTKLHAVARLDDDAHQLKDALASFRRRPTTKSVDDLDHAIRQASSSLMRASREHTPESDRVRLSLLLLDAERLKRTPVVTTAKSFVSFISDDVPRAIYNERGLVGRAAAILFGSAVVGFLLGFADDDVARALLGDDVAAAVDAGAKWTDRIEKDGAFLDVALTVTLNNVRVGFLAFVLGLTGGVGTALILVMNGLHLGAVFGFAVRLGSASTLFRFIVAHGPVELTCVCIAGAAGFCLGRAILNPGARTRGRALKAHARTGGRLLVGATVGFVFIGGVEGFVSPGAAFSTVGNAALGIFLWAIAVFTVVVVGRSVDDTQTQANSA